MASVVNVKVAYIRPKYSDLEDWMLDIKNVYIGRRGVLVRNGERFPLVSSEFANPYKVGKDGSREEVLDRYEKYIRSRISTDPPFLQRLLALQHKTLGCWCKPLACHGDVLLRIINEYSNQ